MAKGDPRRVIDLSTAIDEIKLGVEAAEARADPTPPFFFLAGAGASVPEIPTAKTIESRCREICRRRGPVAEPRLASPLLAYEYWFERAFPHPRDRRDFLRELIEGKPISAANLRLADLLRDGRVARLLITPSFDLQVSRTLNLLGVDHILCDHPRTVDRIDASRRDVQILHVHGSYWFYDACNLLVEIAGRASSSDQTTQTMAMALDGILRNHSPIVVGYSGWEEDVVMRALHRRLSDPLGPNTIGANAYWFCHRGSDLRALPDWLLGHPNVAFVVPPRVLRDAPGSKLDDGGRHAEGEAEPSLTAQEVLEGLLMAFEVSPPELASDPIGHFIGQIKALSGNTLGEAASDLYGLEGIVDRLDVAREADAKRQARSKFEKAAKAIEDEIRRSQYSRALELAAEVVVAAADARQVARLTRAILTAVPQSDDLKARLAALALGIAAQDELERRGPVTSSQHERRARLSIALAETLTEAHQTSEAINRLSETIDRLEGKEDVGLRTQLAYALQARSGLEQERHEYAAALADLERMRVVANGDPELREFAIAALGTRATIQMGLRDYAGAQRSLEDLIDRAATEPIDYRSVAMAKVDRANMLRETADAAAAVDQLTEVVTSNMLAAALPPQQLARAEINRAWHLASLDAAAADEAFDKVIDRLDGTSDADLVQQLVDALIYKASAAEQREKVDLEGDLLRRAVAVTEGAADIGVLEHRAFAMTQLTTWFIRNGDTEMALETIAGGYESFHNVPELLPELLELERVRARLLLQADRCDEIDPNFRTLKQLIDGSEIAGASSLSAEVEFWRGLFRARCNDEAQAVDIWDDLLASTHSESDVRIQSMRVRAEIQRGVALSNLGRLEDPSVFYAGLAASLDLEGEPELVDELVHAMMHQAIALREAEQLDAADSVLKSILGRFGDYPYAGVPDQVRHAKQLRKDLARLRRAAKPVAKKAPARRAPARKRLN